jgi:DNA-binding CsgD family transcriptional regulator
MPDRPSTDWDFVGREAELRVLRATWLAADQERSPIVVIHGEPGIGKTRLAEELASFVRANDGEVLWATSYEGGSASPYGAWRAMFRPFVESLGMPDLEARLGTEARWLAPLLPSGMRPDSPPTNLPAAVAGVRMAEVLARLLDSLPRSPALIFDDMQWADPGSLELFGHVARRANDSLVVMIFRGTGLELDHPLTRTLAEIRRQRPCEYMRLDSLPPREGGELLEQAVGRPLPDDRRSALYKQSGGNPFFLGELGRFVVGQEAMTMGPSGAEKLPESIRAAVNLRVGSASPETRQLLQLASVFTAGFEFDELSALTDLDESRLLDCLEEALAIELVRPLDGDRYIFTHALVRQSVYEQSSPSRRVRLHRRLADALERLHEKDLEPVAAELVRQYHASSTLAGADRGAAFAPVAARVARAAHAPDAAVSVLRLGLDLLTADETTTRTQLLSELALAEAEAGLVADVPRTLGVALDLLEEREAGGEGIAELLYEVAEAFWVAPAGSLALKPLLERALDGLGGERNLAWARLRLLDHFLAPESFGPIPVLGWAPFDAEATRIAREHGTEADYYLTLDGWLPTFGVELDDLIERVDRWQDPIARMRALIPIVGYLSLLGPGRRGEAERLCAELESLSADFGLLPHRAVARVFRSALLGDAGEFGAAAEQADEAASLFRGDHPGRPFEALVALVEGLAARHVEIDWPALAATMWDLGRSLEHFSGWLSLACAGFGAEAYAIAGDGEQAREILAHALPALESQEPQRSTATNATGLVAGAIWELQDVAMAERLLPTAMKVVEADAREFYMTSAELTVARLSAVAGHLEQAGEYFERARTTLDRRDQPVLRAIVDHDEARARLENRRPGAVGLLAAARERFEALGMREWLRRLPALEAIDAELPDQLTSREAEVLRLVAARRTNKEIAAELVVSVHTVERHVQNVYRKIGARNRADAGDYVARVEL